MMYCLWISSRMPARMTAWRSVSGGGQRKVTSATARAHHTRRARTKVLEDEVDVSVVLRADDVEQADDVFVPGELLQVHDLAEGALRVCRVAEGVEAFLQRYDVAGALVNGLPNNAVGLRRRAARNKVRDSQLAWILRPMPSPRTPLPPFRAL